MMDMSEQLSEDDDLTPAWIPISLPWSTGSDTAERHEVLRLSEEYRVWFDAETERRFGPVLELDWGMVQLQAVLDRCPELNDEGNWVTLTAHEDADVRALATRRHQMALRRSFEPHDVQALDWQARIAEAVQRENAGRFRCHPLCRPGVALEIRSPGGSTRHADRLLVDKVVQRVAAVRADPRRHVRQPRSRPPTPA